LRIIPSGEFVGKGEIELWSTKAISFLGTESVRDCARRRPSQAAPVGGLSANPLVEVDDFAPIEPRIDVADAAALGAAKVSADSLPRPIRQAVKLKISYYSPAEN
jgi:hypothetical protein